MLRDSPHAAAVLARLAPHPRRFRLVLHIPASAASAAGGGVGGVPALYVWEPVPPDTRFSGLGMVSTPGPDPPPPAAARCVPAAWCEPAREEDVERVWADPAAGSLWRVRQTGLLTAAARSAAPPAGALRLRRDLAFGPGAEEAVGELTPAGLLAELFRLV